MAALHQQFRPEFLNRLDEIICFKPLTKTELNGIIDILTAALRQRLEDKSLGLEITDAAKQLIIDRGFDPVFGARPLKRYLQSTVETLIAARNPLQAICPQATSSRSTCATASSCASNE